MTTNNTWGFVVWLNAHLLKKNFNPLLTHHHHLDHHEWPASSHVYMCSSTFKQPPVETLLRNATKASQVALIYSTNGFTSRHKTVAISTLSCHTGQSPPKRSSLFTVITLMLQNLQPIQRFDSQLHLLLCTALLHFFRGYCLRHVAYAYVTFMRAHKHAASATLWHQCPSVRHAQATWAVRCNLFRGLPIYMAVRLLKPLVNIWVHISATVLLQGLFFSLIAVNYFHTALQF